MAEAIVGPLVGKLQDLVLSEATALVAVNGDIRSLQDKLMWMQAFLRHADQRRRNTYDELIRVLIKQIRDTAIDAEDAIDLFILKVDLSRERSWTQSIISFMAAFTTQVSVRHNLSIKIAELNARLDAIMKNKKNYMTGHEDKNSEMVSWGPSVIMSNISTKMDDLEAPLIERTCVSELAKRVLNTDSLELLVINVTGKRGVGKATVVREVYGSMKTQTIFDERVWVSFPPYLSVSNILQLIHQQLEQHQLEQLDHQQLDSKNTFYSGNDVEKKVQAKLLHKKFLLVLDGDLSNSDWMALQYALQKNDKGSRVVRIIQGSHVRPPWISESDWIRVEKFLPEETTKFFEKWVSNEGKQETIEVGNGKQEGKTEEDTPPMDVRLHSMTGGLPLAVVLLCGLLKTKEYPHEWDKVLDHLKSKQSRLLDNILTMCFDDLPHDLKSCFLYFAVLPMNTVIEFNRLVCMWRAEGFLRPKDGKTMEKLGKIYIKGLVARNLVKVVKRESFSGGPFVAVHHKVHSFLLLEAQEANFVEIHNGDDRPPSANTRRLSLQNYKDKYAALANSPLRKLRSILSTFQEEKGQGTDDMKQNGETRGAIPQNDMTSPHKHIENMLKESKFLRVINLKGIEIGEELPATISTAAQLQYLCVTACSLERIPPEIGKLKHLETLDVRHTNVRRLPSSFWKIKMLRHVFGSHLILPRRVGNLKYLQTLQTVHPDKNDRWDQDTFKTMVNLQTLYLSDYSGHEENVNAVCEVIGNPELLEYLEKLTLKVSKRTNIKGEVFTSRSQRRITAMALHGKLVFAEPKAEFLVPNLTFLSLKRTKVSKDFIYGLGELPLLVDLILEQGSYKGTQLDFVGGPKFRSLKRLTLSSLNKLEKLVIDKEALVELTHLVIMSYNEDFKVDVDTGREFVKRIEIQDKQLYDIIVRESVAKKQSDQLLASSNT